MLEMELEGKVTQSPTMKWEDSPMTDKTSPLKIDKVESDENKKSLKSSKASEKN